MRLVHMVWKHKIPQNIVIDGVNCRVWYTGQPLVCDICNNNHKPADCPLKGKCRRHFFRHCPKPVWYVPGNPATDVDSDDDNDNDDENGNGNNNDNVINEDVLHNADVVALGAPVVLPGSVEPVVVPGVVPAGVLAEPSLGLLLVLKRL